MLSSTTSPVAIKPFLSFARVHRPLPRSTKLAVKAERIKDEWKTVVEKNIVKPVLLSTLSSFALSLPAYAEAGKLFDFNLTLPVMAGQFLLLMLFLDKTWFGPVGDMLDKRDKIIRDQLANVSDRTTEIERLEKEAEDTLRKARAEAQGAINKARSESDAANAEKYAAAKAVYDNKIAAAFAALETEKEEAIKSLEPEVEAISAEIIKTVLPVGVAL